MEEVFKENPQLKRVYVTTDGTPFYQENDARNHAKSLEDKTVEEVLNPAMLDVVEEEEETEVETPAEETPAEETPAEETPAEETPAEKPLARMSKAELLDFAKLKSITIADQKATNKVLVAEIEAALNKTK